ncbi:hypothetical protein BDN71DRAFT_1429462 [Pleurotus eryngii]|uniref:Uncharacterized protein n=1 Tax=Pleurotus eryngii TaxID=5323 RepID=A0A9P6A2A5_PLEER|nr:hypothetical protein BDN71DRAFT_1429462 [Pleurotus eryngii]
MGGTQPPTPSNPQQSATSPAPLSDTTSPPHQGQVNNANHVDGTFNNAAEPQNPNNGGTHNGSTHGDHFAGPIHGGNVGGRGNNNAVYNSSAIYNDAAGGPPRRDINPRPSTQLQQLQAKIDDLNSKIEQIMDEMGLNKEQKLQRMVDELGATYRSLQREAARAQPPTDSEREVPANSCA